MRVSSETMISFSCSIIICAVALFISFHSTRNSQNHLIESAVLTASNIVSNGSIKVQDVIVRDVDCSECRMSELLGKGKLLIYVPDLSCLSCAQKGFDSFDSMFEHNDSLRSSVLFLSHFENVRVQRIIQHRFNILTYSLDEGAPFPSQYLCDVANAFFCDSTLIAPSYMNDEVQVSPFDGWRFYYQAIHHLLLEGRTQGFN